MVSKARGRKQKILEEYVAETEAKVEYWNQMITDDLGRNKLSNKQKRAIQSKISS